MLTENSCWSGLMEMVTIIMMAVLMLLLLSVVGMHVCVNMNLLASHPRS